MDLEHQILIKSDNYELAATLHDPLFKRSDVNLQEQGHPIIIICHGFVGNRIGAKDKELEIL